LQAWTPSVSSTADFLCMAPNKMGSCRKVLVEKWPWSADFGLSRSHPGTGRFDTLQTIARGAQRRRVAPKLPAVILGSELEIAKGVGPRLPPPRSYCCFLIGLFGSASAILPKREGPENQHVSTRLDGRNQVSYSSLLAPLALRRPAVFSRRGAPWSILKRSTTGVVSMIG
jgi:hypothetical protein